jgi:hypothetical protein
LLSQRHQKRIAYALSGIFLVASLGGTGNALAVTGKDRPRIDKERVFSGSVTAKKPPSCIQKITPSMAAQYGYASVSVMKRASALAHIQAKNGRDATPIAAIAIASYQTGVDFDLMVMKATIESQLGLFDEPILGGSARGLFQFMPATWLTLFSWYGAGFHGGVYADAARQIKFDENKNPSTDDPELTEKILALRSDHYVSAYIKAQSIRHDERPLLRAILGRPPTFTDFYNDHFFGLERWKSFYRELRKNPKALAPDIFAKESEDPNNRSLFYKGHKKRTMKETYDYLGKIVSNYMARIDKKIATALKQEKCIKPLSLIMPPHAPIIVSPSAVINTQPAIPPEDIPPDPEAEKNPIPVPEDDPLAAFISHLKPD